MPDRSPTSGRSLPPRRRWFFIATWLPRYRRTDLRGDVAAGLTVGVMLVPQSMAYALLAGVPPIYGLYAAVVPLLVYPLLGTARHLASGTVALDMLLVASGLGALAAAGTPRYVEIALLLAALTGLVQFLMGLARLGFLVHLLSRPIIAGFTSAAALIIGLSQLGSLLGIGLEQTAFAPLLLHEAVVRVSEVHLPSLLVGLVALAGLVGLRRLLPLFPAPLAVVVAGIVAVRALTLDTQGVAVVGPIPTGLPAPVLPRVDLATLRDLLPTAFALALIQFTSVMSLGKVFAARFRYAVHPNRELFALGAANLAGSLFQAIPVSGSFSRTAVNVQAGARTPLANAFAAVVVAVVLLFATPLLHDLPVPALAAIILSAAFGMIDGAEIRYLFRTRPIDGVLAVVTFVATFVLGVQSGLVVGVGASVVTLMWRASRPHVAVLGHLPGTRTFRDLRRHPEAAPIAGLLLLRIDASFSFVNAEYLRDLILERSRDPGSDLRAVVLDASSINDLDTTAVAVLMAVADALGDRGIEMHFAGMKDRVLEIVRRSGLAARLGDDHFFLNTHRAVKGILTRWNRAPEYLARIPGGGSVD